MGTLSTLSHESAPGKRITTLAELKKWMGKQGNTINKANLYVVLNEFEASVKEQLAQAEKVIEDLEGNGYDLDDMMNDTTAQNAFGKIITFNKVLHGEKP